MTNWVPLEASPELFTRWCAQLGLDASKYSFHDVYGVDPDLLAIVPQPVQAVLLLFPLTPAAETRRKAEDAHAGADSLGNMLWFKQTVRGSLDG